MNTVLFFVIPLIDIALLAMPLIPVYRGITTGKKAKRNIIANICGFFGTCGLATLLPLGGFVSAATTTVPVAATAGGGMGFLAAALACGLSALGAGIAVAAAAPAAIGACSENSKNFGKSIIFVALGEGVALYGLLIAILILNKI